MKMLKLNDYWIKILSKLPETGMGYQVGRVTLKNGRVLNRVVIIQSSLIGEAEGSKKIDFSNDEIEKIEVTHEKFSHRT